MEESETLVRILLVEDQVAVSKLLARLLQKWGHQVMVASSGEEAWRNLRIKPFDFLIADWNLPGASGLTLVEKLRQTPQLEHLPTLMISGRSEKTDIVEAMASGTHNYLTKPFSPIQLKKKIAQVWSARFDGPVAERQVRRILAGQANLDDERDSPLVVLGEATAVPEMLTAAHRRAVLKYLTRVVYVLAMTRAEYPDIDLGYVLQTSTRDLMKRLRRRRSRERIKLALVATDMGGNSILLVRLANINRSPGTAVLLVFNRSDELTLEQRAGLESLEVELLERTSLTAARLTELVADYVVKPALAAAQEPVLTPTEIHERICADIQTMSALPILPEVYQRIMDLDRNPDSELKDWAVAVERDPLGSAVVLRRARAPHYGFRGDLQDVQHAVVLLGKSAVKDVIVSEAVLEAFKGVEGSGFKLDEFWLHSVGVGVTAKILSMPMNREEWTAEQRHEFSAWSLDDETVELLNRLHLYRALAPDSVEQDPFVGGMIHDIGKAAMVQSYPGLFPLILEEMEQQGWNLPMYRAENLLAGGLDHTVVGEILGTSWGLGEQVCRVIRSHHAPEPDESFSWLIGLADFIGGQAFPFPAHARSSTARCSSPESDFLPDGFFEAVYIEPEDLEELTSKLAAAVQRIVTSMRH